MTECRNKQRHADFGTGEATLWGVETVTCRKLPPREGPLCEGCWNRAVQLAKLPRVFVCPACGEDTEPDSRHLVFSNRPIKEKP